MRIALDAMGSDDNPVPDVAGGVAAAREFGEEIILVGDEAVLSAELAKHETSGLKITIQHASQVVTMMDKPRDVVRAKPDSSMHVGMNLVKAGAADAFVTAGNTGGALAIAMLGTLRRIPGIKRPALGFFFPTEQRPLILDGGANADSTPEHLLQFGQMGSLYAARVRGISNPRVGLISNGEEEGKGNKLIQETAPLMAASNLNFVGNIEPKDLLRGAADVGVTDGFVGNMIMKTAEATASYLVGLLRQNLTASVRTKAGALLARPAFTALRAALDPDEIGGVPLLGVDGVVIIGHGRSNAHAIKQAIGQARRAVAFKIVDAIKEGVGS